jgi:DNA-binding response OmpR family regulator
MNERTISGAEEPASAQLQTRTKPLRRILVVEDDVTIRQLNTEILSRSGYEVDAAEDGAVAWDALQANRYDLMITDHNMPKVSGVELLMKLRAARMTLPVIMATGVLPQGEFARNPWLQLDATLLKPYTIDELLGKVQEVLRTTNGIHEPDAMPPGRPLENRLPL